jgi:iron complex outermembrane receptor protein
VKTFNTLYPTQSPARRAVFSVSSTATGCAILLLAAGAAYAADQPGSADPAASTEQPEEIIITGIRKSIEDAIAAKRNDSSIIEAVSAEDIGKLPDSSIAESIARLPGIAAQRTNGRAQTLSVRGLGPDFTVTTLNGREQASVNDNRSVELDQYPSELVSQVKVYKTPNAGMSYQGIAGTADIETVHPLNFGHRAIAGTYRREKDGQSSNVAGLDDTGNRANLTYIDQFRDHTVGVAFGVAYNKTPYQAQTREIWGYADDGNGNKIVGGDKDGYQTSNFSRTGFLGVLEFKPNDDLHMLVDAYHSNFKELQTIRRMEYGLQWSSAKLTNPGPVEDGRVTSGTFQDVPFILVENYATQRHAKLDSIGWNTDYKVGEHWDLNGDLSWSKVKRDDLYVESTASSGAGKDPNPANQPVPDNVSFTTNGIGVSSFTIAGANGNDYSSYDKTFLTDPGGWGGGPRRAGYVKHPNVDDEIKALRLSAKRDLSSSVFSDVSFGLNYAERTKSKDWWQSILYLPVGVSHAVVPESFRTGVSPAGFFGYGKGIIGYDALGLFNSRFWQTIDARIDPNAGSGDRTFDVTNTWRLKEKLTTAFFKLDIDSHLFGVPVTGNIGVQTQTADQKADIGYTTPPPDGAPSMQITTVRKGASYTDVLPSMNLNFAVSDDVKIRAAAATAIARPRMDDMAGGSSVNIYVDGNTHFKNGIAYWWEADGGGNPQLKPWKANTYDLSVEKYFGGKGYLSMAMYYKELTSYIYQKTTQVDFTGVLLPDQAKPGDPTKYAAANANRTGFSTVKVNGHGGIVRGMEFTASLPGSTLTPWLNNFGMIFSAAFNQSIVHPQGTEEPLPGLSPKVINTTLYYERNGFSVRVSDRYRGSFRGEVPDFDGSLANDKIVKSESVVDAQVGYEFREGTLKGLSVNLTGTNLNDAPFALYDVGSQPYYLRKYERYGSVYALTLTYKL